MKKSNLFISAFSLIAVIFISQSLFVVSEVERVYFRTTQQYCMQNIYVRTCMLTRFIVTIALSIEEAILHPHTSARHICSMLALLLNGLV